MTEPSILRRMGYGNGGGIATFLTQLISFFIALLKFLSGFIR